MLDICNTFTYDYLSSPKELSKNQKKVFRSVGQPDCMDRRKFMNAMAAIATTTTVAGCAADEDSDDEYQSSGDGENGDTDENGTANGDEELDPEEVEERPEGEDVLEFGDLNITEHEESVEEREFGDDRMTIEGIVENTSEDKYDSVTVSVRAYDADGHQLDRYLDTTSDLQGGGTWRFEVTILEAASDVDDWDIAVTGHQW